MTTFRSSENVTNPRSKALSYSEFKQTPFRGSARRDSLTLHGMMWLATSNDGTVTPEIDRIRSGPRRPVIPIARVVGPPEALVIGQ